MSKFFTIDLKVFPFDIIFSVAQTKEEFLECVKDYDDKHEWVEHLFGNQSCRKGRTSHDSNTGVTMISIVDYPDTPFSYGVVSHEIFHAVDMILKHIGVEFVGGTDEVYAYLIQYVTQEFYKQIKEI